MSLSRATVLGLLLLSAGAPAQEPLEVSPSASPTLQVTASPVETARAITPPGTAGVIAPVAVRGRTVFVLHVGNRGASADDRARAASKILAGAVEEHGAPPPVTLTPSSEGQRVRVGDKDVLELTQGDAAASGLEPKVYFQSVRSDVERFIAREKNRARLQEGVLAVSMAVFLGLLALLGIRWLGRRTDDMRAWIVQKAQRSRGLRVRELEVLSPEAVESLALAVVGIAAFLARVGIVYSYLVYVLSRFDTTRDWVPQLSRAVLSPFAVLFERLGAALPAAVLLVVGAYLVRGGLRIVRVFLDHVSRGEVRPRWLGADMAAPTRPLAAVLLVLVSLVALGPVVSGASDGVLSHLGLIGLATIALAAVPALSSILLGTTAIYSRRYALGHWVQIGSFVGEVTEVSFLDVSLVPLGAGRIRVPHLLTLFVSVRHLPGPPAVEIELPVSASAAPAEVMKTLREGLAPMGAVTVSLASLGVEAAWYRVSLTGAHPDARSEALARAVEALAAAGIALGAAAPTTRA